MDFMKCIFVGKVEDKPRIKDTQGKKQAFFNFVVNDRVPGANGQWVDNPQSIPMFATDKKAEIIEQYVVAGHELTIECKYQSWKDGAGNQRHVFTVQNIVLGWKPKATAPEQVMDDGGAPPR